MSDSPEDMEEEDPLRLARLAIFCSVFGASILLGLAMSIVRQDPPAKLAQKNFIRVTVFVTPTGGSAPILNLIIRPPGRPTFDLPLASLGSESRSSDLDKDRAAIMNSVGHFQTGGLSYFGEVKEVAARGRDWEGWLVIQQPVNGQWSFGLRWVNNRNCDPFKVSAEVTSSLGPGVRVPLEPRFGRPVTIPVSKDESMLSIGGK